jgi:hypothetical protein
MPPPRRDAEPLATAGSTQGSPYRNDVVADGDALVLWSQVWERGEELLLVGCSDGVPAVASQTEWHRLEETVGDEGLENRVDVARCFRFAVGFEEAQHLGSVHRLFLRLSERVGSSPDRA